MVGPQSTHRVAMATFWRTFHHDENICLLRVVCARPPTFIISTITYKVMVHAPAESADTLPLLRLYPYMYSVG